MKEPTKFIEIVDITSYDRGSKMTTVPEHDRSLCNVELAASIRDVHNTILLRGNLLSSIQVRYDHLLSISQRQRTAVLDASAVCVHPSADVELMIKPPSLAVREGVPSGPRQLVVV